MVTAFLPDFIMNGYEFKSGFLLKWPQRQKAQHFNNISDVTVKCQTHFCNFVPDLNDTKVNLQAAVDNMVYPKMFLFQMGQAWPSKRPGGGLALCSS